MTEKIKDIDYLSVSAYVRALENELLTADQYEQLITAKTYDEEVKLLQSFGYDELEPKHPEAIDADLIAVRAEAMETLERFMTCSGSNTTITTSRPCSRRRR